MTNAKVEPIIPDAPVPSQVSASLAFPLPKPQPVEKEGTIVTPLNDGEEKVEEVIEDTSNMEVDTSKEGGGEEKVKGTITIDVYENIPYKVKFDGVITGSEIDIAWKAMMKEYKLWKAELFKKLEKKG